MVFQSNKGSIRVIGEVIYDFNMRELFTPIDQFEEKLFIDKVEAAEEKVDRRLKPSELDRLIKLLLGG